MRKIRTGRMSGRRPKHGELAAADSMNLEALRQKLGAEIERLQGTKGIFTDNAFNDAMILAGGTAGAAGLAGLAGADGGDALATGMLGAGVAAAPVIHNAYRDPAYRTPALDVRGRNLVALIAAGAGAGAGTNLLTQALMGTD